MLHGLRAGPKIALHLPVNGLRPLFRALRRGDDARGAREAGPRGLTSPDRGIVVSLYYIGRVGRLCYMGCGAGSHPYGLRYCPFLPAPHKDGECQLPFSPAFFVPT